MKTIDDLFKRAARLDAPDSLGRKVMAEIHAGKLARKPGWLAGIADWLKVSLASPARAGFALGAAAVAIAIMVYAPATKPPAAVVADMRQINDYINEALADQYAAALNPNAAAALESDDVNEFVTTHVESVFWINGGSDNA